MIRTADYEEQPCFFPAGDETLFGMLTRPTGPTTGIVVIMLTGGGYVTSLHRNRVWVRLARRLAAAGHHAFRLDYHGTGESSGTAESFMLDEPFVDDVAGAVAWLRSQGLHRHVFVGSAFGARTALAAAPAVDGLEGVVLIAPSLSDVDRQVRWRNEPGGQMQVVRQDDVSPCRVSEAFLEPLRELVAREIPVLVAYASDEAARAFLQLPEIASLWASAGCRLDVEAIFGVPLLAKVEAQRVLMSVVVYWIDHGPSADPHLWQP